MSVPSDLRCWKPPNRYPSNRNRRSLPAHRHMSHLPSKSPLFASVSSLFPLFLLSHRFIVEWIRSVQSPPRHVQRRFLLAKQLLFWTVFLLHLSYQRNAPVNIRFFVSLFIVFVIFSKIVIFFAYFLSKLPSYSPFLSYISLCEVLHLVTLCPFFVCFSLLLSIIHKNFVCAINKKRASSKNENALVLL